MSGTLDTVQHTVQGLSMMAAKICVTIKLKPNTFMHCTPLPASSRSVGVVLAMQRMMHISYVVPLLTGSQQHCSNFKH